MAPKHFLSALCLFACHLAKAQTLTSHIFRPSTANPEIVDFDNFQYAYLNNPNNNAQLRNKLVVFLPGTGGTPFFYREFLQYSASLGYHSLGLMYPNSRSVARLCNFEEPQNPDCPRDVRLEIIDGSDRTDLVEVDRPNSIENRLIMAIAYLQENEPSEEWGQFLHTDSSLAWDRILICGHSQGGGHAALIAKRHAVNRCLVFAAADWFSFEDRLADWANESSSTPPRNMYIFAHERDPIVPWNHVLSLARACDLDRFGEALNTDSPLTKFRHRHILTTSTEETSNFHNSVVVDQNTPLNNENGEPTFQPIWRHMLLSETPPLSFEPLGTESITLHWQTGILEESTNLQNWTDQTGFESPRTFLRSEMEPKLFFRVRQ